MDKAPAYGAGDYGFESQYGLTFFLYVGFTYKKKETKVFHAGI